MTSSSPDTAAMERAQSRVRALVDQVSALATSGATPDEFYTCLLHGVVDLFNNAAGGAVWLSGDAGDVEARYDVDLETLLLHQGAEAIGQHAAMLRQVAAGGQASLVLPFAKDANGAILNPTEYLLMVCPLRGRGSVIGFIEIFIASDAPPQSQQGNVKFLAQLARLADDWYSNRLVSTALEQQELWSTATEFSKMVHRRLEVAGTAYQIANEGLRVVGCDRVSVVVRRSSQYRVAAVSGQATVDGRSNVVVSLTALARRVLATGEALWYYGDMENLPPQVEQALETHLDESLAASIVIIPLHRPGDAADSDAELGDHRGEIVGALVVEQVAIDVPPEQLRDRLELITPHAASALSAALEHESVPLLPLWRLVGRLRWLVELRNLPKTVLAAALLLLVVGILCLAPADFDLEARGQLVPVLRRNVFAEVDGLVTEVAVRHGDHVEAGDVLVKMENTDLDVRYTELLGDIEATREQLLAGERLMHDLAQLPLAERSRVMSERLTLTRRLKAYERQQALLERRLEQLEVQSAIDGEVITWDVERRLLRRSVVPGQVLMVVADPQGDWQLEVNLPEERLTSVVDAQRSTDQPLSCTYILASDPGVVRQGRLVEVEDRAEHHDEQGHSVRLRVQIDVDELPHKRADISAVVKVHCGRRPLGYVWFHEVIEWFYLYVWF